MMLALIAFIATQHEPPADLVRVAAMLRSKTAAEVTVADANGWQIWFEARKPITDDALKHVHDIKKLTTIRLLAGGFTDKGIANFQNLPDLTVLVLISDKLTDECTKPISKLQSVTKLDLNKARLTKAGMERIAEMRKMERLYLYNAKLNDADVEPLKRMKWLKLLDLPPNLSSMAVSVMRSSLPNTEIEQRKASP